MTSIGCGVCDYITVKKYPPFIRVMIHALETRIY